MNPHRRKTIELWRAAFPGLRLYWRSAHPHWRTWHSDDIAMSKHGALRVHYKSIDAIRNDATYELGLTDENGDPIALDGSKLTPSTYTLIDANGMILAIDEREIDGDVDESDALYFWSVDGELYELLPHTYTVLERGVERAAAFAACGEVDDADG